MKKLLLSSVAICGLAVVASPAHADIDLDIGGWFKGYGVFTDQESDGVAAAADETERNFDFLRTTEVHLSGETTLDNGLTIGAHFELEADGGDSFGVEESYVYFAGGWGRFNVGAEDGAQYLLQVSAPAADENVDGLRSYIQPFNVTYLLGGVADGAGNVAATSLSTFGLDYEMNLTGYVDKITYLSPVVSGFQGALSYTPDLSVDGDGSAGGTAVFGDALASGGAASLAGTGRSDFIGDLGSAYEVAVRYEGEFEGVGITAGGGYTNIDLEDINPVTATDGDLLDDVSGWNLGLDLDWGAFGIGAAYTVTDYGNPLGAALDDGLDDKEQVFVVGLDYTTGPFRFGGSYYTSQDALGVTELGADRYTGGVVYTYGPGMTLRGVVTHTEFNDINQVEATDSGSGGDLANDATKDTTDGTALMIGTQIVF